MLRVELDGVEEECASVLLSEFVSVFQLSSIHLISLFYLLTVSRKRHPPPLFPENLQKQSTTEDRPVSDKA